MNTKNTTGNDLRTALEKLGAREYEMVALGMDENRGLAAVALALEKGVDHPVSYAIKVFDNPEWTPTNEKARRATNVSVEVKCATCDGDRFVAVTDDRTRLYGETYKPCPSCNSSLDASFWRADGSRFVVAT